MSGTITPDEFVQLWAEARGLYYASDFPKYGGAAWQALPPDDPRRLAAALDAAEMWRKYGDEEALIAWLRDVTARGYTAEGRPHAELAELRKPKPPHRLQATPGWPPIAIPGRPGRYLTYIPERRAA